MDDHGRAHPPLSSSSATPRRTVLRGAAGLALAWLTPVHTSAQDPRSSRPTAGDLLVKIGDTTATPLAPGDIATGATPTMAWPMVREDGVVRNGSRLNRLVLVRLDPAALGEHTKGLAADGVVAYSAVCTHTGCEVGAFLVQEQTLYCDCHQSKFDPRDQGRVTDGPAPRNLPALPLRIVEGRLVVAGPFTSRPGFEQG
jgi:nitrite reductase/ring-hydroxylating ferredoxin subunit